VNVVDQEYRLTPLEQLRVHPKNANEGDQAASTARSSRSEAPGTSSRAITVCASHTTKLEHRILCGDSTKLESYGAYAP
jgi:hypothetical protein